MSKKNRNKQNLEIKSKGDVQFAQKLGFFDNLKKNKFFQYFDSNFFAIVLSSMAILGIIASLILSIDKFELLKNPSFIPPCSINKAIDCLPTMKSVQSEVFGFSNTFLGLIFYAGIFVFGFIQFFNKELHNKLWKLALLPVTLAVTFSYWLIFNSVFVIGSLCPYCLISCFASTVIFFVVLGKDITSRNWLRWRTWSLFLTLFVSIILAILIYKYA